MKVTQLFHFKDSFKVTSFCQTVLMKYAKPLSKHDKDYKDLLIIFFSFSVAALSELNE